MQISECNCYEPFLQRAIAGCNGYLRRSNVRIISGSFNFVLVVTIENEEGNLHLKKKNCI